MKPETEIFKIFERLEKETKQKVKIEIIRELYELYPAIFMKIVKLVFDKNLKFNVSYETLQKIPCGKKYTTSFEEFWNIATAIALRKLSGNVLLKTLQEFFKKCDEFHCKWYKRILAKDLRIGVGLQLIKKAIKGDVDTETKFYPMLAQSFEKVPESKLEYFLETQPCFWEVKIDGLRCVTFVTRDYFMCYSRNGKRMTYFEEVIAPHIKKYQSVVPKGETYILDGEIYAKNWNISMAFSSSRKYKLSPSQEKLVKYYLYDFLIGNPNELANSVYTRPYIKRKEDLKKFLSHYDDEKLIYVPHHKVEKPSIAYLLQLTDKLVAKGWEGLMLKLGNAPYEPGKRTYYWIKFKKFYTLDLLVVDVVPSTKRPNEIQALLVKYKDQYVKVSGLPYEYRRRWFEHPEEIIGKIVEVKFLEVTKDGKLRHPTFIRVREDKDKPDA